VFPELPQGGVPEVLVSPELPAVKLASSRHLIP
jgi:hypothetical protein